MRHSPEQHTQHFPPSLLPEQIALLNSDIFILTIGSEKRLQKPIKEYLHLRFWDIVFERSYTHNLVYYCCSLWHKIRNLSFSLATQTQDCIILSNSSDNNKFPQPSYKTCIIIIFNIQNQQKNNE